MLKEKLDTMVEAVEREFGTTADMWKPKGGIFLWFKLPDSVDVRKLVKPAADAGIHVQSGSGVGVQSGAGEVVYASVLSRCRRRR